MAVATDLYALFDEFNQRFFDSRIPRIPVEWASRKMKKVGGTFGWTENTDGTYTKQSIRLSPVLINTHEDLRKVLAHEMVHAYIAMVLNNYDANHGPLFKAYMLSVNAIADEELVTIYHSMDTLPYKRKYVQVYRCDCGKCEKTYKRKVGDFLSKSRGRAVYTCRHCKSKILYRGKEPVSHSRVGGKIVTVRYNSKD